MLTVHMYDLNDPFYHRAGYINPFNKKPYQPGIWSAVASFQDIETELGRIGRDKGKIDDLWFHLHGNPGTVGFKIGLLPGKGVAAIGAHNVGQLSSVCSAVMAAPARVLWTTCSLGWGQKGETFLRAAGSAMLGHGGGVMLASTRMTYSLPFIGEEITKWTKVRVAKVSPGGSVTITTV